MKNYGSTSDLINPILRNADVNRMLSQVRLPICITDPTQPDNPIVFANSAFSEMSGYESDEIIGRNCRFLQGPKTDENDLETLRQAIVEHRFETVEILNYRKDGTEFINALQIGPIYDDNGDVVLFFGSQLDVTRRAAALIETAELQSEELLHRLRNIVNVMSAVIRMTAREVDDQDELVSKIIGRLHALSAAHFQTLQTKQVSGISVRKLAETILGAYSPDGKNQHKITGDDVVVANRLGTALTLALHELATNCVKYGAFSNMFGKVWVDVSSSSLPHGDVVTIVWRETGGPEVGAPTRESGSKIITSLIVAEGGTLEYDWERAGLVARITLKV